MNKTSSSSAWHLMAALAQLTHDPIADVHTLARRIAALLEQQPTFIEGALFQMRPRSVLAAWGVGEKEAGKMVPTRGKRIQLPAGWRSTELGTAEVPGLLALKVNDAAADEIVLALGAQVSLLWQTTIQRMTQTSLGLLDALIQQFAGAASFDELQTLFEESGRAGWSISLYATAHFTPWHDQKHDSLLQALLAQASGVPEQLPSKRPAALGKHPGMFLRVGSEEQPEGVVVVHGSHTELPGVRTSVALLARTVATTYERLLVGEEIRRREMVVDTLNRTLMELAHQLDVEEFLQSVLVKATELLDATGGIIYFADQTGLTLEARQISGLPHSYTGTRIKRGMGLIGQVAETRQAAFTNHESQLIDYAAFPESIKATALAAVPLYEGDLLIGVLAIVHTTQRDFSASDLELLDSFAVQASLALRAARLFDSQRKQARDLFVLYENSRAVTSSFDLKHILERLVGNVQLALNVDQVSAWLFLPEQHVFQHETIALDDEFGAGDRALPLGTKRQPRAETMWATLLDTQQPVVINNTASDPRINRDRADFQQRDVRSVLGVPLLVHDTVVGVLVGEVFDAPRLWTAAEITLAQTLAGQAASAIGNARLLSDEQRRGSELSLLQDLGSQLNAGQSLNAVIQSVGDGVQKIMPNTEVEICLYEPQINRIRTVYATQLLAEHFASETGEYAFDQGFSGWLARHRSALRIGNVADYRAVRPVREYKDQTMKSYLGLPLLVGDDLIGTIELGSVHVDHFDAEDERLLKIIASQAAQAIRNMRRYEATDEVLRERVRELTALQRISRELTSTLQLEQLLPAMITEIMEATGCEHGLVALNRDPNDEHFEVIAALGYHDDLDLMAQTSPLFQNAVFLESLRRADAVIVDDVTNLDVPINWPGVRSVLFAPILYENHIAGAIIATDSKPHAFNHTALDFVRSVSDQAALAIGNAQHFAEQVRQRELLQQRASLLNEVLEIGNALRADMELNVLLEQIAFSVSDAAGFRVVLFNLIDNDRGDVLRTVTGAGLPLAELSKRGSVDIPLRTIDQYLDPQYRIGRAYFVPTSKSDAESEEWHSGDLFIVPLYSTSRELIGTMVIDDPFDHLRPTRRTVETLEIFANQAAIAVENASLFEQRSRQIGELAAINRISRAATSSLNFNDLAREVFEALQETVPIDSYYLGVFNTSLDTVVSSFCVDHGEELIDLDTGLLRQGSLLSWIVTNRSPLWFNDLVEDVKQYPDMQWVRLGDAPMPRSWIGVPLITGEGAIQGVVSIQHTDLGRYSGRHVELLQTVANQLAVAVENARLYGDAQRQLRELALVNQVGSLTSSTLNLEDILKEVYHALSDVLPMDAYYAFIYDDSRDEIELKVTLDEGAISVVNEREPLLARSPSQWVLTHHEPLLFTDMPSQIKGRFKIKRFGNLKRRVRSWLGVPLRISPERSVGLLSVQHYEPNVYGQREQRLLQTIANQVSLAVQNARLFGDRERQIRELDALGRIGQLMSASFALDEMLRQTAHYLQEVTNAPIFFTLVYDPDQNLVTNSFAIQEGVVANSSTVGGPPRPGSLSDWVLRNRRPLVIADTNDAAALERLHVVPVMNAVEGKIRSPRSWIGVPVLARDGAPIGVMSLQDYSINAFDDRTTTFMTNVSSHVSLGLQKVQLFQERDRQIRELESMRRIGQVTSSTLDMNEMMHNVYQVLKESLPIEGVIINIYDAQIDMLVYSLLIDRETQIHVPPVRAVKPRSLTDWVLRNRKPLLFRRLVDELKNYPDIEPFQHGEGERVHSWMGVPLVAKNEQPIGMLALQHYSEGQFDEEDLQFLSNVAYQVTLGVQNVRLYEQTEQSLQQLGAEAERLALINHVSNLTASTLDPQVLYDLAVEEMVHATGADGSRLVIFDYEEGLGRSRAVYPEGDMSVVVPVTNNATIPWMQQHRRPLIINDIPTNPLSESFRETLGGLGIKRVLLVPLIVKGELIGSVGLDSYSDEKHFTPRDAETCQTIANQVTQALENARLFNETERQASVLSRKVGELSVLLEAGQALSSIREPDVVLGTLVGLVGRQLVVDTVLLTTFNAQGRLAPIASLGIPDEFLKHLQVERGSGLIGTVAETGVSLSLRDVNSHTIESQYPEFNQDFQLTSFLGVPVMYRDEVTGVLSVMTHKEREFSSDDTAFLSALADQAAIALENARLFSERERQIATLQALNEVTKSITSTLDRQRLLHELHAQLGKIVDTRFSFIALFDRETDLLSFPVLVNNGKELEQSPMPLAAGVLSQVVREGKTIVLDTVAETRTASRMVLGQGEPIASWVGVPIMSGERVLGVINIQSLEPYTFTPQIVQFLQSAASQTAIALENARLFADRERQVAEAEILSAIGRAVTATFSPESLAASILEGLAPLIDVSNSFIALYDAPSNLVSATYGLIEGQAFSLPPHMLENDFLKTVMFEQQPILLNTIEQQQARRITPQLLNLPEGVAMIEAQSVVAVPITMGAQTAGMLMKQPLGVLAVLSVEQNAFSPTQLRFLEDVADQSSNAVQKTMLFSERERRIRELDTLNRISQSITSTITLDDILTRLYEGLAEIVDMSSSFIGLYDADTGMMQYEQAHDKGEPIELSPLRVGVNVNSWVIEHRQPLLLNTAEEANEYRDEASRERVRQNMIERGETEESYLVVPIIVGNDVLGVINIQSYEQYAFSEYDMGFVSTVAAQAAASIANARLFDARERSIQQLRTLSTIGQALGSTVRFEDLLRVIYEQAGMLVDTRNFYLALYDERRDEVSFPLFYEHGAPVRVEPQRHGNGLTEYVIRKRQPVILQGGNIRDHLDTLGVELIGDLSYSWLGIPLVAADKVVGVLSVQDFENQNAYNDDDIQLLTTVANQAAQALENARLFSESRESVRELSTLSDTSVSLASTLDIEELLAISASSAIEMARADFGGVIVIDPETEMVTHSLILDSDRSELLLPLDTADISLFKPLRPLRQGQVVTVFDAAVDEALSKMTNQLGIRGVVFLPMMREGLRGVVFVGMLHPFTFEDRSIASLLILTTQIGQALNNAQLFEQIRLFNSELEEIVAQRTSALADANAQITTEKERVEALYNIATELGTTLDRSELLVRTLDLSAKSLNVNRGTVLMLDRETHQLTAQAVLNEEIGLRALESPVIFEQGDGLANWVLNNSEGVIIDNVLEDPRWVVMDDGRGSDVRSVIAVPLFSSDQAQGILMLYSTLTHFFQADHLRFLSTIAGEVSSALHNADLYNLVYESADRLSDAMWQQREQASRTTAILQSVSEGVLMLDHESGKITLYNPAAEEVLRIPHSAVIEQTLEAFAVPHNEEEHHEQGRALELYTGLKDGTQIVQKREIVHSSTIELPGQPGQIIAANFAPVTGDGGMKYGVVVVLRDITREIEADRAKRDFIANVSHELRTPLTPIRGFVDLMLIGAVGDLSDVQKDTLNTIKNNTMRMLSLVEDLLEIGRLESGRINLAVSAANINLLVRDTIAMWQNEIKTKDMTLELDIDDSLPLIEYDSKRIGQVFTNLVSNAIKYSYAGGTVKVRTFLNEHDMVQVDVSDSGVGLKPEDMHKLFQRFFRADSPLREQVGGTGLGLSIAKSFIELHHGDMWVQSVYGEGSTFSFTLPKQQPRPDLGPDDDGQVLESVQSFEETTS